MSIQDVCLSINKLSNDALDYPILILYILFSSCGPRVVLFTRLLDIVEYLLPRTSIFQTLLVRVSSKFLII